MSRISPSHLRAGLFGSVAGALVTLIAVRLLGSSHPAEPTERAAPTLVTATALPGQPAADLSEVVAQSDELSITVGHLQQAINAELPALRARYQDPVKKKAFLDTLIRTEVQIAEARRRRLDGEPEVVRTANQIMIKRLMNDVEREVKPEDVTDAEMRSFYEAHPLEYNTPEKVRVSAIVLKDRALANQLAKTAKGVDAQAFRELVGKHSVDESTRQRGGDLQYFAIDATTLPRELVVAAFGLVRTGDVAGPIATKEGFYVIQQTGRLPAISRSFESVRAALHQRLFRDKRAKALDDFVTGLVTRAKVTIREPALAKVRIDTSDAPGDER